jgi:hypothetical protein
MFKFTFTAISLALTTACMGTSGVETTQKYSGSLTGCPGVTGVSATYSQTVAGLPVRCGPQNVLPVTYR